MAEKVMVYVLSCGQGMANWIEYFTDEGDDRPSGLGLVDLGGSSPGAGKAVKFISDRLATLQGDAEQVKIDICLFSHQDSDHWNLIDRLLAKLETRGVNLKTGEVWKAGMRWAERATAAVNRLAALSDSGKVKRMKSSDTSYKKENPTYLYQWGAVQLRVLAVNAPVTLSARDMVKNGTSAVMAVELGGLAVILPGDATWETMDFVNTAVYEEGDPPADCLALSIPHHGALRTAVRGYMPQNEWEAMNSTFVEKFAGNLKSQIVIASAGFLNRHKHPMVEIMDVFSAGVTDDPGDVHAWVGYRFSDGSWTRMPEVTRNIFTTVTTIEDPPRYRNGIFILTGAGSATFEMAEHRPDGTRQVVYRRVLRTPSAGNP